MFKVLKPGLLTTYPMTFPHPMLKDHIKANVNTKVLWDSDVYGLYDLGHIF